MDNTLSTTNSFQDQVENVIKYCKKIFEEMSDYETNIIRIGMNLIQMDPPSTKLMLTERITQLVRAKSDLQYLILKARELRKSYNVPYVNEYNQQFTILTRQNRPSKQAIESEMHFMKPELREYRDKIDDIDTLLEFLNSYMGFFDKSIAVLENRRFDV